MSFLRLKYAAMQEMDAEELIINVFKEGTITVNGKDMDRDSLFNALKHAARKNPEPRSPFAVTGQTPHQEIVGVMDACAGAGLSNLNVGTLVRRGS